MAALMARLHQQRCVELWVRLKVG